MKDINWKVLSASVVGTALEFYDFVIYGFLASIIAPLFFPADNPATSYILSLAVFAVGFLARPLGGFVFGRIGDRYGRKRALSSSIILMACPTFFIGLLPTYADIGILAPLLLVSCRLLQGVCTGGEYNGAGIFVVEHAQESRKGFVSGVLVSGCVVGMLLGSGASFIVSSLHLASWRLPFLLGIIPGVVGYYIRRSIAESPDFEKIRTQTLSDARSGKKTPLEFVSALRAAGVASFAAALFYFQFILLPGFLPKVSKVSAMDMATVSTLATVVYLVSIILMGWISDYVGRAVLMKAAALASAVLFYPLFYLALAGDVADVMSFQFFFAFLLGTYVAPSHAVMAGFFPVERRYAGVAISYGLGLSLLGGTTPMFSMLLYHATGIATTPALYIVFCALIGFFAVYKTPPATKYAPSLTKEVYGR